MRNQKENQWKNLLLLSIMTMLIGIFVALIHEVKVKYGNSIFLNSLQYILIFSLMVELIRYLFRRFIYIIDTMKDDIRNIKSKLHL